VSTNKKQVRAIFRNETFRRDRYRCVVCGKPGKDRQGGNDHLKYHTGYRGNDFVNLDAHHVRNRNEFPNGGYVKENGVTLCDDGCHVKAEEYLNGGGSDERYSPEALYARIGSSHEKAVEADERLGR
jgi:hypothetical protein